MKLINGKQVLESISELVSPRHTVLLVHDMQNDFCTPGGKVFDIFPGASDAVRRTVEATAQLLTLARRVGAMVAFSRASHLPGGEDESPVHLHHLLRRAQRGIESNVIIGTWGHGIIEQLSPQPGDFVFDKFSLSSFHGSLLDRMLRVRGIKTIVFTGVASHSGILTTARVATTLDYYVVVAEQCVAGLDDRLHEAALEMLKPDVYPVQEIVQAWQASLAE